MKISLLCLEDVELETEKLSNPFFYQAEGNQYIFWDRNNSLFCQNKRTDSGAWYLLLTTANKPYHVKPSNLFKLQLPISSRFGYSGQDHLKLVFSLLVAVEAVLAYLEGLLDCSSQQCFHISNSRRCESFFFFCCHLVNYWEHN